MDLSDVQVHACDQFLSDLRRAETAFKRPDAPGPVRSAARGFHQCRWSTGTQLQIPAIQARLSHECISCRTEKTLSGAGRAFFGLWLVTAGYLYLAPGRT